MRKVLKLLVLGYMSLSLSSCVLLAVAGIGAAGGAAGAYMVKDK
ncbi:hypothetical protein [Candidatus Francisella endociliophora]|nr:hypothetical protein [Francisella sp. FSC1006]